MTPALPENPAEWTDWILARRGARNALDPRRAYASFVEQERGSTDEVVAVATIFLTNRECPRHCLMCDLWKNTLPGRTPAGAIPEQIGAALAALPAARQVKLYNAGSFFDPRAIPSEDLPVIAGRLGSFERVIVECHPALVGESCVGFRDLLAGRLEVAMGLETVHPGVLPRLNKGMTLAGFERAASFLASRDIGLRSFLLVGLPFADETESLEWSARSIDFAFECGSTAVVLIPTRTGNGALEALVERGEFTPPSLGMLEEAAAYGIALGLGRVFADLWELERLARCASCFVTRRGRLATMNLEQRLLPPIACRDCDGGR